MPALMSAPAPAVHVLAVLAMELSPGSGPACAALPQADAAKLARRVARDLAALAPDARALNLTLAATHFDPAEVLRGGWPLHRSLLELGDVAPGRETGPRVIVFGADARGVVPAQLRAEVGLHGGQLRVLPLLLNGDARVAQAVGATLEQILFDRGMAPADTALLLQDAFGARIEHVRYLTVHDLAAMTAMQYRNQGLEPLWKIVETAMLAPGEETWLDVPPEPLVHYSDGEARIALFTPTAWRARHMPDDSDDVQSNDPDRIERLFAMFQARQRQFAAVLEAHGVPVTFAYCNGDARSEL